VLYLPAFTRIYSCLLKIDARSSVSRGLVLLFSVHCSMAGRATASVLTHSTRLSIHQPTNVQVSGRVGASDGLGGREDLSPSGWAMDTYYYYYY